VKLHKSYTLEDLVATYYIFEWFLSFSCRVVATLLGKSERMILTFLKWGLGSSSGLLKLQSSILGVKKPCIETLFISLESYRSVDVQNGLA
jgi:hypothetical protein